MITINVHPGMTISLGREGENLARKIIFDVSSWQAEYGDGKVSLVANKDGAEPYPCDITVDGSIVTWMITSSDTAESGFGRCELHYIVGDTLVKSDMWRTYTADALGTPAPEPPEPQQAWVDKVLAAGQAAVDASVNSPKVGDNGNWFVWDFELGKYVDTGVVASGGVSTVSSVNGKTGEVVLTAEDVGAVPAPATAQVGQTVVVKAVDEAGKPTEWEAADMAAGSEYSPTLPLVASITLTEEVSMIEVSTDKDGNPLALEEMDINMLIYGGAGNVNRDSSIMYFNGISTAFGRIELGTNIGAAGKFLTSSQYFIKREYGYRRIGQYGYGNYPANVNNVSVNQFRFINGGEEVKEVKYPKYTQINLYPTTEGYTFGVGTIIDIYGR